LVHHELKKKTKKPKKPPCLLRVNLKSATYSDVIIIHIIQHIFHCRSTCGNTYPDEVCRKNYTKRALDPPLLYDLHADPGETYPLDTKEQQYADLLTKITSVSQFIITGLFMLSNLDYSARTIPLSVIVAPLTFKICHT